MSSPTDSSTKWKILAAVFVITTILGFATTAYYYNSLNTANSQNSDLAAKNSDLKNSLASANDQVSSLNSQVVSLNAQVTTLNGQMTADKAQIVYLQTQLNGNVTLVQELQAKITDLQTQVATDTATIMTLQVEVATDQATITTLEAQIAQVNLAADFTWTSGAGFLGCSFFFPCTPSVTDFFVANSGTNAPVTIFATVTFYSSMAPLCSSTYDLAGFKGPTLTTYTSPLPTATNCIPSFSPADSALLTSLTWV